MVLKPYAMSACDLSIIGKTAWRRAAAGGGEGTAIGTTGLPRQSPKAWPVSSMTRDGSTSPTATTRFCDGLITPQEFYRKHVGLDLGEYVCLIHDPRPAHRFDEVYTVKFLGNVVGGEPVVYLNVDLDTIKRAAVSQLKDGEPVWFGCDVGKVTYRDGSVHRADMHHAPAFDTM